MEDKIFSFKKCDVFTPDNISKKMASFLKKTGTLLEPSVGNGNLLKYLEGSYHIDVCDIKQEYLDQINLPCVKYNEDFLKSNNFRVYDNIILNPPYIKFQDLSVDYRKFLKEKWDILSGGNIDIYYAFLLKCLSLLADDGVMVAITPNSFIYNKSASKLRKYLIEKRYIDTIIDYGSEKVFKNISCYCCITVFSKTKKSSLKFTQGDINEDIFYKDITDSFYPNKQTSHLTLDNLAFIKNGIATLRDKIYIHSEKKFDEPVWKPITNVYRDEWVIFPYNSDGTILLESTFKETSPLTYAFLESNKNELKLRDHGNKIYPKWYSFGRTQSLKKAETSSIYVSTLVNPENIEYSIKEPILHISSLCITPKIPSDLPLILSILEKNKLNIIKKSSKRGSGWLNLSSSILKELS